MTKRLFKGFVILFLLFFTMHEAYPQNDSLLQELSQVIENKEVYIREKQERIGQLQNKLQEKSISLQKKYALNRALHNEYRTFKYDSAFAYAVLLQEIAGQLADAVKVNDAKLQLSHTLLSSGFYKEALDSLVTINPAPLPDSIKTNYYALMARTYYDLAGFTQDYHYSPLYTQRGKAYVDSALALLDKNELEFYALRGMKDDLPAEDSRAGADFKMILENLNPSLHQYAMAANSLGNIYYQRGEEGKAIEMMARAAIADMKASVTEGVALMTLAEFLYYSGDESRAYAFIKQALKDADFYGAKQRKVQVAAILPVIEGERLATVESQRSRLLFFAITVSLLSLLVVVFAFIIFKQLKQLRKAKKIVTEANTSLQEVNQKLQETNLVLQETNSKLIEANKIKEEYIGYSFNMYTEYLEKIDKLKKGIQKRLMSRKFDDINHVLESINLKKERESLYQGFDKTFLKLFPNFIPAFNSFFSEGDRFELKDRELLNVELRIFALIRIGIHDHEQIARILEYSVRTIYNYKTKVKNRSLLSNEAFEQKVMEIKAF